MSNNFFNHHPMKKLTVILFFITAITFYPSCKKADIQNNPDPTTLDSPTIMGFKDSTQLIKSLSAYYMDGSSNVITDSITLLFHYDTIKRRIAIVPENGVPGDADFDSVLYQYNSDLFLTSATKMYSTPPSNPDNEASVAYIYDADKVIQSAIFTQNNGDKYTYSFDKTALPGNGYRLSWTETSPGSFAGDKYLASFNSQGQMISNYNLTASSSDSIEYDASGNTTKVIRTEYSQPYNLTGAKTFTLYDFTSRDSKGDQLYNLRQVLDHGFANLNIDIGGINLDFFFSDFVFQFSKYPATSTIINLPTQGTYCVSCDVVPFTYSTTPTYDSRDRLVKYKLFFNDNPLAYQEYHISYYK